MFVIGTLPQTTLQTRLFNDCFTFLDPSTDQILHSGYGVTRRYRLREIGVHLTALPGR